MFIGFTTGEKGERRVSPRFTCKGNDVADPANYCMHTGFTLIELMVVVTIIGILAAVAIPNFVNLRNRALEASVKANMHTAQMAVEEFCTGSVGVYPGDLDTRINQANPQVLGPFGNMSVAGGARVPPFPPNSFLKPAAGFKNPYAGGNNVIDNLLVGPPPPVPPPPSGITYFCGYQQDGITPAGAGNPAFYYSIVAYGTRAPINLTLP